MKAIVQDTYGSADVLELTDIDVPVARDGDVLLRVHAAGAHIGDWHFMTSLPYLIRMTGGLGAPKARVRGLDVAGVVEGVGKDVTQFHLGDEVFGVCDGSFAEYATTRPDKLAPSRRTSPSSRPRPFLPPAAPRSRVFAMRERCTRGRGC